MTKGQVCIADEPRLHTTKFVDLENVEFKGTKLCSYIDSLEKTIDEQSNRITALESMVETLINVVNGLGVVEKQNAQSVNLLLLKNR